MTQSSLVLRTSAYTRASLLWTLSGGMTPLLNIMTRFIQHYYLGLDDICERKKKSSCYTLSGFTRQKSLTVPTDVVKTVLMHFIMLRCYIHNTLECFTLSAFMSHKQTEYATVNGIAWFNLL